MFRVFFGQDLVHFFRLIDVIIPLADVSDMTANGPAVEFSKRNPTTAPPRICPGRPESCNGARMVWRGFWHPGTNFIEHYACRDTSLIGAANLSPVTKLVAGTGAVSRYKLSRSQKFVKVQDFNCVQIRVSGYMNHYKIILGTGAIKNRDKLIDPTVRVIVSACYLSCFESNNLLIDLYVIIQLCWFWF
jgi:hypothetical protein